MVASNNNDLNGYFKCVARYILAALVSLCILAIMCNCSTTRKTEKKTVETVERKSDSIINGVSFDRKWFDKYIEASIFSDEVTKITIYDTNLPMVENTDRPPVVADIEKMKTVNASITDNAALEHTKTDTISVESTSEGNSFRFEEQKEKKQVKSAIPTFRLILLFSVIVGCVIIALWGKHLIQDFVFSILNKIFK